MHLTKKWYNNGIKSDGKKPPRLMPGVMPTRWLNEISELV
jgi:hypothetical protein